MRRSSLLPLQLKSHILERQIERHSMREIELISEIPWISMLIIMRQWGTIGICGAPFYNWQHCIRSRLRLILLPASISAEDLISDNLVTAWSFRSEATLLFAVRASIPVSRHIFPKYVSLHFTWDKNTNVIKLVWNEISILDSRERRVFERWYTGWMKWAMDEWMDEWYGAILCVAEMLETFNPFNIQWIQPANLVVHWNFDFLSIQWAV